ncbi:P-loop containing nucleoside triphosphate hydrolase protein [Scheffersomyces xylosifermentans]|uniref:P-loop containing nucleoside triphosphate hydrolase protein n=1 Tax=Scheffersomyces xylosifermentans TaxID=1304137 RepID=UPI00315DC0F7
MCGGVNCSSVVSDIRGKLSVYLNRDVNDKLIESLAVFYRRSKSYSDFKNYVKVLGVSIEEYAQNIFSLVEGNIGVVEEYVKNNKVNTEENNTLSSIKAAPSGATTIQQKPKRPKLSMVFDDDEQDELLPEKSIPTGKEKPRFSKPAKPIKQAKGKLSLSFSDEEEDNQLEIDQQTQGKSKAFTFKKIKKEDALRIKQDIEESDVSPERQSVDEHNNRAFNETKNPRPKTISLSELSKREQNDKTANQKDDEVSLDELRMADERLDFNIDNDREWYNTEEYGQTTREEYDDIDSQFKELSARATLEVRKRNPSNRSGGGFDDSTGEYIDYDHEQSSNFADLSRIPISSHSFVPPFLEATKKYLQIQLDGGSAGRSIGPTINPIKDSTSELAILAKTGSFIVKERKSKRERAQQAKERAGYGDSKLGSVLGADEEPETKPYNKDETEAGEPTNEEAESIQKQRKLLPAFAVRSDLMRTIAENQVTVVIGETGSGKTTQLTQFLYEEGFGSNLSSNGERRIIGCTQPRRVAAMSVAKRVSEEMNCTLGEEVGFAIRFEDKTDPKKTLIKYMTAGILLREILADPMLEKYSCVIMDEAHERTLDTDILLGLFKQLIRRRRDLKLIITSATMNADRFTHFFGDAPQFTIPGRTFPVEVFFSKNSNADYVEAAVKQVLTIHLQNTKNQKNDGDILVFMTGQEDIEITCQLLQEKLDLLENPPPLDILPIYSTLPADLQKKIFSKSNSLKRKVVVATNIAETSLTVDGIKYVVDSGLVKLKVYNPKLGMDTLQLVPISIANAQQRSGRAGRTGPGITYRLYTERATEEDKMYVQPIPEIQRTNLTNVLLLLKSLKVNDINQFPFLDPPPKDLLNCSLYELWSIGALDNLGELTELGKAMTKFPIEPTLSKTILLSSRPEFHCSEEIITIVAMLSVPSVVVRPKERAAEADLAREKFLISESDHLTLLNIYTQWETNLRKFKNNYYKINSWCNKNFLQLKSLLRAKDIKNQIVLIMKKNNFPLTRSKSDEDVRKCLCASFYQQSAKLVKVNVGGATEFLNLRHSYMKMYLHPTSSLIGSTPESIYVIYHELVLTTKEYMNVVTVVDPLWLLEYGSKFFYIADKYKQRIQSVVNIDLPDRSDIERALERDTHEFEKKQEAAAHRKKMNLAEAKPQTLKFKKRRGI